MTDHRQVPPDHAPAVPRRALAILVTALVANAVGHSYALMVLPPLGRQMGFGDIRTGWLIGLAALLLTVSGPVWGSVCDRWGRRLALMTGLAAAAAFAAVFAGVLAGRGTGALSAGLAFTLLLSARLAQALLTGGLMPGAQAFLADATTERRRASGMGLMGASFGAGTILGGALSWGFGASGAGTALLLIAGVQGLAFLLLFLLPVSRGMPRLPGGGIAPLSPRQIWPFLLTTFLGLGAYGQMQQVMALRLQDGFDLPLQDAVQRSGAVMMATMIAMVITQGAVVRRLDWPPLRMIRVGAIGAGLCLAGVAVAPALPVLMVGMVGVGAMLGLLIPGNLAGLSLRAGGGAQARAAGLNAIGQGVGLAVGPVVGATMHQLSPQAPFLLAAVLMLTIAGLAFRPRLFGI
ncbi:MFS transporter [Novispirillum itersonii]|uniref:MFS transporter n=1 Tax=Novispirillum itersonii TaxID=189 RepID=UPI0003755FFA|nr:MFS transporter [Novispirillum itersonii]